MQGVKDFVVRIGFDYDKTSQKQAEENIQSIKNGIQKLGLYFGKAEGDAKSSLQGVAKSFEKVDTSITETAIEAKKFKDEVDDAKKDVISDTKEMTVSFGGLGEAISKVKGLLLTLAAGLSFNTLIGYTTAAADKFEQLGNTAKEIGTENVSSLAAMQYAYNQMGIEVDTLNDGLKNMTDYIGQAKMGEGEGLEVFKALNIKFTDEAGQARDTIAVFDDLVEKLNDVDHATQVAYINMLGLDTELMKGISANKDELEKFKKEFIDTYSTAGINIEETAKKATEFNQSLRSFKQVIQTIKDAIGAKFLDVGVKTFDRLRVIATENLGKIVTAANKMIDILYGAAKAVFNLGKMFVDGFYKALNWWSSLDDGFKNLVIAIGAITLALKVLNSEFMKSPIARFIALVLLLAAAIEDFQKWKNDSGNTVLGKLLGPYQDFLKKVDSVTDGLGIFKEAAMWAAQNADILAISIAALPYGLKVVKTGISTVSDVFKTLGGIITAVTSAFGPFKAVLKVVWIFFQPVIGAISWLIRGIPLLIGGLIKLGAAFFALPFGWIIAIIAAIIAAVWLLYENWDTVCKYAGKIWDWLKEKFGAGIDFLKEIFSGFFDFLGKAVDFILQPFQKLWGLISDIGKGILSLGKGFLKKIGFEFDEAPAIPSQNDAPKKLADATKQNTETQLEQAAVSQDLIETNNNLVDSAAQASSTLTSAADNIKAFNEQIAGVNSSLKSMEDMMASVKNTASMAKDTQDTLSKITNNFRNNNTNISDNSSITINVRDSNEAGQVLNNFKRNSTAAQSARNNMMRVR